MLKNAFIYIAAMMLLRAFAPGQALNP